MEMIKAEAFKEYMNDYFPKEKVVTIGGVDITVRNHLSMEEMIDFVDFVVKNCTQDNGETYIPELKDFLIRREVINRYTNIDLPERIEDQYNFVYGSDIISKLTDGVINRNEFNNILQGIEYQLAYVESVEHREYKKKIDEIYSSITTITDQVSRMYEEMTPAELTDLMKVIVGMKDGSVNEEEIARAVMHYKESQSEEGD